MNTESRTLPPDARAYFEFLGYLGLTKHQASTEATRELIERCHIGAGDHVLCVVTGVGATPAYVARRPGSNGRGEDSRMLGDERVLDDG